MYTSTKSLSLYAEYMRKKFDEDAANPKSGSIWTTRMLFMVGVYFLTGVHAGSYSLLVIVDLCTGMAIPFMPLMLLLVMNDFGALLLTACFDRSDPIEQELEDDHWCGV
jgi:hypothetical protein